MYAYALPNLAYYSPTGVAGSLDGHNGTAYFYPVVILRGCSTAGTMHYRHATGPTERYAGECSRTAALVHHIRCTYLPGTAALPAHLRLLHKYTDALSSSTSGCPCSTDTSVVTSSSSTSPSRTTSNSSARGRFRPQVRSGRLRLFLCSCVRSSCQRTGLQSMPTASCAAFTWRFLPDTNMKSKEVAWLRVVHTCPSLWTLQAYNARTVCCSW